MQPKMQVPEAGYGIKVVVLLECHFNRLPQIDFQKAIENQVDIRTEHNLLDPSNQFTIVVTGTLKGIQEGQEVLSGVSKIAAVFEKLGDPELLFETFCSVNGPAIIYPYVREHLTDLSRRASVPQVFLPPVNFTKK